MSDIRVLIVDDNRDFAYLMELSLADVDGCSVVGVAADGRSALDAIERLRPDVMLLDMALPETDGFEILKAIGKMSRVPLVFVMSAIRSREISVEAMALGATHYFIKPIDLGTLVNIIREAFDDRLGMAEKASKLLNTIKVPPGIRGFKYLKDIIVQSSCEKGQDFNVVVRRCAAENNTETEVVRRTIRYAIRVAWDRDKSGRDSFFYRWKQDGNEPPDAEDFVRAAVQKVTSNG